jgi:MoxR-like ATPase
MVRYAVDVKNEKVILLPEKTGPGLSILGDLVSEKVRDQAMYALAHLVSGKNVVFYGAPGTGKTRIATELCKRICNDFAVETANSEWSNFEIIGGYMPDEKGIPAWQNGVFSNAVEKCTDALKGGKPFFWLVLDELNRANLDLAFGKVFTLLDIGYRTNPRALLPTKTGTRVPLCFRILATMNTYDKALLFSLGYAFMRRFAFIQVPSLLVETSELAVQASESPPQLPKYLDNARKVIDGAAVEQLSLTQGGDSALLFHDLIFPEKSEKSIVEKIREKANEASQKITVKNIDFMEVLLTVASCATENGVEMGQALLIDAVKFVISYYLLFPEENMWSKIVDEAIVAYIVPQLEYFMPQLRKAQVFQEQQLSEKWSNICECVKKFGLAKSFTILEKAKANFRVI